MTDLPLYAVPWRELQAKIRDGGAVDTAERVLAAIDANGSSNAYRKVIPERVMSEARAAAARLAVDAEAPALCGAPVSAKDLYAVQGYDLYAGTTKALDAHFPAEGPVIRALKQSGAVITGKSHTVEFAFGGIGTNAHYPAPLNPWDADVPRVSGGSSSGAGVSLWTGTAALALGSDTAGSVRVPASFTGAIGLKTTHGRWSLDGITPLSPTLDTAGLLALDADMIRDAFEAIDGAPAQDVASVDGVRFGVFRETYEDLEPGIADAVEAATKELEAAGAILTDVTIPETGPALDLFRTGGVAGIEFAAAINNRFMEWRDGLDPNVLQRFKVIEEATAIEYLRRLDALAAMAKAVSRRMADAGVHALIGPTTPITAPTVDEVASGERYANRNMLALRNTVLGNFFRLSGFTIPVGKDVSGLPVGLQIMTPADADAFAVGLLQATQRVIGRPYDRLGAPPRPTVA
jgi:aspartyl-tRNA(Asn)/glutamyl-tRNA(Gln) amidotransferase subunit A